MHFFASGWVTITSRYEHLGAAQLTFDKHHLPYCTSTMIYEAILSRQVYALFEKVTESTKDQKLQETICIRKNIQAFEKNGLEKMDD